MPVSAPPHAVARRCAGLLLLGGLTLCVTAPAAAQPLAEADFAPAAVQGFGDRDNSIAWSMVWWDKYKKLFAGTARASYCVGAAVQQLQHPRWPLYPPPPSADASCPPDPADLHVQAEIWSWSPDTAQWTLVLRSPQDVPIPGRPGRFVARDIGFRGMELVTEPDGTEALYVSGVSSRTYNEESYEQFLTDPQMPPPRILRSTDGATFTPIPQVPGTVLFEQTPLSGFRGLTSLNNRVYVVGSVGISGFGYVLESADPARGNNSFRKVQVTADDLTIFELEAFNGSLYLVTGGIPAQGAPRFSVLKTTPTGTLPYTFTEVVPPGAFHPDRDAAAAYSMFVFEGLLYVGTAREVLRINPDDTWEVVVGAPRTTPNGPLAPLSGLDDGFGHERNIHIWRMASHEGALYVGTLDATTEARRAPILGGLYGDVMGFDLYATTDGWHFSRVTRTAFAEPGSGDVFDHGLRTLASSPHGLFAGSSDPYYGLDIWRGQRPADPVPEPQLLEVETVGRRVVLSWEQPAGVSRFRVLRDTLLKAPREAGVLGPFVLGDTWAAVDTTGAMVPHGYQVVAEDGAGRRSGPSNVAASPSAAPAVDFPALQATLAAWGAPADWLARLQDARALFDAGSYPDARAGLLALAETVEAGTDLGALPAWRMGDVRVLLAKLTRRVALVQLRLVPPARVSPAGTLSSAATRSSRPRRQR